MTDTTTDASSFLPSDEELYAQIDAEAADIMKVPSVNSVEGDPAFVQRIQSLPVTMETLSPEDRGIVTERLKKLPPALWASKEPELIQERMRELVRAARIRQGPGSHANELTQTMWELAREADDLDLKADRIFDELSAVSHYDVETGAPVLKHPFGSPQRKDLDYELGQAHELCKRIRNGEAGQKRLAEAREKALANLKFQLTEQHVAGEAKRRAEAKVLDERIEKLAESRAKMLRGSSL